jgi:hypothetical protein
MLFTHFLILLWCTLPLSVGPFPTNTMIMTYQVHELCYVLKWLCEQDISNFFHSGLTVLLWKWISTQFISNNLKSCIKLNFSVNNS